MNKLVLLAIYCLLVCPLLAQHKVKFVIREETAIQHDSFYIAGTFNNWDTTSDNRYLLRKESDRTYSITLDLPAGSHRYKYTRGNWSKVEKLFTGGEVRDKAFEVPINNILKDTIRAWRDEIIADKWHSLAAATSDSLRVESIFALTNIYGFYPEWYNPDSAYIYMGTALLLLEKMRARPGLDETRLKSYNLGFIYLKGMSADMLHALGNFPKELEIRLDNFKLAQEQNDNNELANTSYGVASAYNSMQDNNHTLEYAKKSYNYLSSTAEYKNDYRYFRCLNLISLAYSNLNQPDSALLYASRIYNDTEIWDSLGNSILSTEFRKAHARQLAGDVYLKTGKDSLAWQNYKSALTVAYPSFATHAGIRSIYGLARIFDKQGLKDSALHYGRQLWHDINYFKNDLQAFGFNTNSLLIEVGPFIAGLFNDNRMPDSAFHYLQIAVALKDSLYNLDKVRQFQGMSFNESLRIQQQEQEIHVAKQQYQSKIRMYALAGGLGVLSILAIVLFRNNRQKQKAKDKIEKAYADLGAAQAQLVQSEKMASLGELTAGIAHEIQNPLNFVNNFSEVNEELLIEMKEELSKGNIEEARSLADSIIDNQRKINHHGKRADAIVKGMLQHSRSSSGQKEPTDINALADEYLRLAYHGLRARDKSFNAGFSTDFDKSLGKIGIVPQDMGRVILNLITNAFYAVREKARQEIPGYEPTVSVSTRSSHGHIHISVRDNGNGVPQNIADKIFQPFFTTKPTGQGTGLGLSMSYDIVTKAHSGELKLETKEGEYAEFTIILPV